MGFFSGTKRIFFSGINPKKWMDVDNLKKQTGFVKDSYVDLMKKTHPEKNAKNTDKNAPKQLNVPKEVLLKRQNASLQVFALYALIFLGFVVYTVFLFKTDHYFAAMQTIVLSIITAVLAVTQHIQYFMLKKEKRTFHAREWFKFFLMGDK